MAFSTSPYFCFGVVLYNIKKADHQRSDTNMLYDIKKADHQWSDMNIGKLDTSFDIVRPKGVLRICYNMLK